MLVLYMHIDVVSLSVAVATRFYRLQNTSVWFFYYLFLLLVSF